MTATALFTTTLYGATARPSVDASGRRRFSGAVGAIGDAVPDGLLPATRNRGKARTKKNATSKYGPTAGDFPQTSLDHTIDTIVTLEALTQRGWASPLPPPPQKPLTPRDPSSAHRSAIAREPCMTLALDRRQ